MRNFFLPFFYQLSRFQFYNFWCIRHKDIPTKTFFSLINCKANNNRIRKIFMWQGLPFFNKWTLNCPMVPIKFTSLSLLNYIFNKFIYVLSKLSLSYPMKITKSSGEKLCSTCTNFLCLIDRIKSTTSEMNLWQTSNSSITILDIIWKKLINKNKGKLKTIISPNHYFFKIKNI